MATEETATDVPSKVSEYKKLFADRYSDKDLDYVKVRDSDPAPAPCVPNWYDRPKRNFNYAAPHPASQKRPNPDGERFVIFGGSLQMMKASFELEAFALHAVFCACVLCRLIFWLWVLGRVAVTFQRTKF